ncbi:hypothetical protein [Ensifer aridi]|uniref:hypothetical protein n=1 Tax=Ensifer aridi TaxID=1708715 RepID=UPI000A10EFB4|nr:hypothetical protein [Ensifer aridi]
MARTILYIRPLTGSVSQSGREFAQTEQIRSCTQAAIAAGCSAIRRDTDGEPQLVNAPVMVEPLSGSDKILRDIIGNLQAVDTLVVASLQVLGSTPSKLVANLAKVMATGCRLIVVDMPVVDFPLIRRIALGFTHLEEENERLANQLDAHLVSRAEQMRLYERETRKMIVDQLYKRGVDLMDLIPVSEGRQTSKVSQEDPVRGRHLKELRLSLEMSGEEAGQLLEAIGEKPLSKAQVSECETGKASADRMDNYETAIRAEIARRKVASRADRAIAKATNGQAGPPLTTGEREYVERVLNG